MAGKPWTKGLGPRPHTWQSGPDPIRHRQFHQWGQMRNQAQYRGEAWSLTFEDFVRMWGELWHSRGRTRGSYCMTRDDYEKGWDTHNTVVITRQEHARKQANSRRQRNASGQLQ